ncbi:MAG: hypothetical protein KR126chlam3_00109 [Chlamydiae bacterium]|nr:hypothetical protein [Chlamydiota bacterium]
MYQVLAVGISNLISFWIIYHCAYRKYGTAWLTWCLVIGPIIFLVENAKIFNEPFNEWTLRALLLDIVVFGYWYFLSVKFRKDNKNIQIQSFISSDTYAEAVASIRSAKNLDDLQFKFHEAFRKCPSHFKNSPSPHHTEMKERLTQ